MSKPRIPVLVFVVLTVMLFASYGVIAYLLLNRDDTQVTAKEEKSFTLNAHASIESDDLLKRFQEQVQDIDATHLIRKYHRYLTLFDVKKILKNQMILDVEASKISTTSLDDPYQYLDSKPSYFSAPNFKWQREDDARPLDVMRLTFRGNGIPKDAEKLAENQILDPKLQAFYEALAEPNTVIWKSPQSIHFNIKTFDDKSYLASSTPFIAIRPINKRDYARMKSAALPFLWNAYSKKQEEDEVLVGDVISVEEAPIEQFDPFSEEGEKELEEDDDKSVFGVTLDSDTIESLFFSQILGKNHSPEKLQSLRSAFIEKRWSLQDLFAPQQAQGYLNQLAQHDPEFSSLFLINNLFDQYNLFSLFQEGVTLRINAIDTKLNITYISYNISFETTIEAAEGVSAKDDADNSLSCNGKAVNISDEFFLIITDSQAYLMRVYLPDCGMSQGDYQAVDNFINNVRILNDKQLSVWGMDMQAKKN